jgi:hypothetical protein
LYQQANRGTSCLSEADLITFSMLPVSEMRVLSRWLTGDQTLVQASWLARKKLKKPKERKTAET